MGRVPAKRARTVGRSGIQPEPLEWSGWVPSPTRGCPDDQAFTHTPEASIVIACSQGGPDGRPPFTPYSPRPLIPLRGEHRHGYVTIGFPVVSTFHDAGLTFLGNWSSRHAETIRQGAEMNLQEWGTYWRNALVSEIRKKDPLAFSGPNKFRFAYQGPTDPLSTVHITFQNGVLALVDGPRDAVVLAAFPMWLGPTRIANTDPDRAALLAEANRAADENAVQLIHLPGPNGNLETVYIRQFSMPENRILLGGPPRGVPGGATDFTDEGISAINAFANAAARAARAFVADADDMDALLEFLRLGAESTSEASANAGDTGNKASPKDPTTQVKPQLTSATSQKTPQPGGNGCFIATAVYGSYDAPAVLTLRRFRDDTLASSVAGRTFIRFYYWISPSLSGRFMYGKPLHPIGKRVLDSLVRILERSPHTI